MNTVQMSTLKRGYHISFTGIDGAGKSTQAGKLAFYLQQKY
jgi:thymidylate kinase